MATTRHNSAVLSASPTQKAREYLRHAQTFLGEATAQLSLAGFDDQQAEASRLYDLVQSLDEQVYNAAESRREASMRMS